MTEAQHRTAVGHWIAVVGKRRDYHYFARPCPCTLPTAGVAALGCRPGVAQSVLEVTSPERYEGRIEVGV